MIPTAWKRVRLELQLFLDNVADQIIKYVPETDMLTPEVIEGLLKQTLPNLPWNTVPSHGPLFQAALSSHSSFYAHELYKRFQAASSKIANNGKPLTVKSDKHVNLLAADGARKALEQFKTFDEKTKSSVLLSKNITPEVYVLGYEYALANSTSNDTEEPLALEWAKRVSNLLLADNHDLLGRTKSFLHILSPFVSDIYADKVPMSNLEETYKVILDFISLSGLYL